MRSTSNFPTVREWLFLLATICSISSVSDGSLEGDKNTTLKANVFLEMPKYEIYGMTEMIESIANATTDLENVETYQVFKTTYKNETILARIEDYKARATMDEFWYQQDPDIGGKQELLKKTRATRADLRPRAGWPKIRVVIEQIEADDAEADESLEGWTRRIAKQAAASTNPGDVQFIVSHTEEEPFYVYVKSALDNDTGYSTQATKPPENNVYGLDDVVAKLVSSKIEELLRTCICEQWTPTSATCFYWADENDATCRVAGQVRSDKFNETCVQYLVCAKRESVVPPQYEKYCIKDNKAFQKCDNDKCYETCKRMTPVSGACNATCEEPSGFRMVQKQYTFPYTCCEHALEGTPDQDNGTYPYWEKCTVEEACTTTAATYDYSSAYIAAGSVLVVLAIGLIIGVPLCVYFFYILPRRRRLQELTAEEELDKKKEKESLAKRQLAARLKHTKHLAKIKSRLASKIAGSAARTTGEGAAPISPKVSTSKLAPPQLSAKKL